MTSPLSSLPLLRNHRRRRESSWDQSGGNRDFWVLDPGETRPLAEMLNAEFKAPVLPTDPSWFRRLRLGSR